MCVFNVGVRFTCDMLKSASILLQIPLCGYGGTSSVELMNVSKSSGGFFLDLGQVRWRRGESQGRNLRGRMERVGIWREVDGEGWREVGGEEGRGRMERVGIWREVEGWRGLEGGGWRGWAYGG